MLVEQPEAKYLPRINRSNWEETPQAKAYMAEEAKKDIQAKQIEGLVCFTLIVFSFLLVRFLLFRYRPGLSRCYKQAKNIFVKIFNFFVMIEKSLRK